MADNHAGMSIFLAAPTARLLNGARSAAPRPRIAARDTVPGSAVPSSDRRSAYTLPELLIVLAVLAGLAGLALPAIRNPLDRSRLRSAAQNVRTILTRARAIAVREGQVVSFAWESGGAGYRLVRATAPTLPVRVATDAAGVAESSSGLMAEERPWNEPETAGSRSSPETDDPAAAGRVLSSGRLPDGVTFARPGSPESMFTESEGATVASRTAMGTVRWVSGAEFLPNGRTEDFSLHLVGARGFRIDVRLRGLTGAVSYSAAYRPDDHEQSPPDLVAAESVP